MKEADKFGGADMEDYDRPDEKRGCDKFHHFMRSIFYQSSHLKHIKEIEKKGVHADTVAVPLFEKIAEKTLIHDKII